MNVVVAALSAPSKENGVSRHAINLARALLSQRIVTAVHFLAGKWQSEMFLNALSQIDERLHTHWLSLTSVNLSRLFWYWRELPHIAEQLKADVVHLTFPVPITSRAFSCSTVLSLHDLYPFDIPENFGFWKRWLARRTVEQCIKRVDGIACVSSSTREHLNEWFPFEVRKTVVIPNVIEADPAAAIDCGPELLRGKDFVLCVAQHRRNKNIPFTIRVFEAAIRLGIVSSNSLLVVVGIHGPETARIEAQISKSKLRGRVSLLSGVPDSELRWCYKNCALLLAPSIVEGFGLPIAEGMRAGCRIVCSDIPAFREVGGESCHFVPWAGDVIEAYAEAIRTTLALPKPDPFRLPHLSPSAIGRRYLDLYESLSCPQNPEVGILRQREGSANTDKPGTLRPL